MKPGAGKRKGSAFERKVCVLLSLWVTEGKRKDVFWRSAMSGGRATVHGTQVRQAGDVCAVAPEGHSFADRYFVECKMYRNIRLPLFVLHGKGPLAKWWKVARQQAVTHKRLPWLIVCQNNLPILLLSMPNDDDRYRGMDKALITIGGVCCSIQLLSSVLQRKYHANDSDRRLAPQRQSTRPVPTRLRL